MNETSITLDESSTITKDGSSGIKLNCSAGNELLFGFASLNKINDLQLSGNSVSFNTEDDRGKKLRVSGPILIIFDLLFSIWQTKFNVPLKKPSDFRRVSTFNTDFPGPAELYEIDETLVVVQCVKNESIQQNPKLSFMMIKCLLLKNLKPNPFITNILNAFKDDQYYYFSFEYASGGELMSYLSSLPVISDNIISLYLYEFLVALHHLHKAGIYIGKLQKEHVLLDKKSHLKLCFHSSIFHPLETSALEFVAPEVILGKEPTEKSDLWSLGAFLYHINFGHSLFDSEDYEELKVEITTKDPHFPHFKGSNPTDLARILLQRNPESRPACEEVFKHPLFANLNYDDVVNLKIEPGIFNDESADIECISASDFRLDSQNLPTSSAYAGFDGFSFETDDM